MLCARLLESDGQRHKERQLFSRAVVSMTVGRTCIVDITTDATMTTITASSKVRWKALGTCYVPSLRRCISRDAHLRLERMLLHAAEVLV